MTDDAGEEDEVSGTRIKGEIGGNHAKERRERAETRHEAKAQARQALRPVLVRRLLALKNENGVMIVMIAVVATRQLIDHRGSAWACAGSANAHDRTWHKQKERRRGTGLTL